MAMDIALVTGASGFVGSAVARALVRTALACAHWCGQRAYGEFRGPRLRIVEGDISDAKSVARAMKDSDICLCRRRLSAVGAQSR